MKKCISIRISLKFVPKGPIDNKSALVQVMAAWRVSKSSRHAPEHQAKLVQCYMLAIIKVSDLIPTKLFHNQVQDVICPSVIISCCFTKLLAKIRLPNYHLNDDNTSQ